MAKSYLIINEPENAWELAPSVTADEVRQLIEKPRVGMEVLKIPIKVKGTVAELKFFPSRVYAYTIVESTPAKVRAV
jgi:hypothetical protein